MGWIGRSLVLIACLAIAAPASAANGPRFKPRPGLTQAQAVRKLEQRFNRTPGFSNANCRLLDGNARIGWRHTSCIATVVYQGMRYGLRTTYTPVSCSRQRTVVVVAGLRRQAGTGPWKHDIFVCAR
jgi:hypothetical protein